MRGQLLRGRLGDFQQRELSQSSQLRQSKRGSGSARHSDPLPVPVSPPSPRRGRAASMAFMNTSREHVHGLQVCVRDLMICRPDLHARSQGAGGVGPRGGRLSTRSPRGHGRCPGYAGQRARRPSSRPTDSAAHAAPRPRAAVCPVPAITRRCAALSDRHPGSAAHGLQKESQPACREQPSARGTGGARGEEGRAVTGHDGCHDPSLTLLCRGRVASLRLRAGVARCRSAPPDMRRRHWRTQIGHGTHTSHDDVDLCIG